MKILVGVAVGLAVLIAVFVAWVITARATTACYYIVMANRTHRDFEGAEVYYEKRLAAEGGRMVSGALHGYGPVTLPVPDEALVVWSVDTGRHRYPPEHEVKVKLSGLVPKRPRNIDIWCIIEEDGSVTVTCVGKNDLAASVRLAKTLDPYLKKRRRGTGGRA
jgi:hypothetical protein